MACLLWTTIVTGLTGLYMFNSAARYYMKFTLLGIVSILIVTFSIPLMLPRPKNTKNGLIPGYLLCKLSWLFGVKWSVEGQENLVKDTGSVIVVNHQSVLDLFVVSQLWSFLSKDKQCRVISKKEIFYLWPMGLAIYLWGGIFIDRKNRENAQEGFAEAEKIIREKKERVLVFPEGTRNLNEKLLPFKKGAFHLALAAECPIQPIVVSRYTFLGKRRFDKGTCVITILPPIPTEGLTKDDLPALMDETYKVMSDFSVEITEKITNKL